jgi:transcriptional regulator with XRE-family HTH domain
MGDDSEKWLADLAARLKAARTAAGISVRAAAEAAGVSPTTVQRSESGTNDTGIAVVRKLAVVYGVSLCDLTDPPKKGKAGR